MAPIGGGPGGPVGSSNSFTGPSESLELVGDHAYAFANAEASTTSVTALDFTTGNYYFVGVIQMNPQVEYTNGSTGASRIRIKLNGATVGLLMTESTDFYKNSMDIIIPAYTSVTVEVVSSDDQAAEIITIGLAGRIYRG
tara:strand:+ start:48 stop:467 length:420 start_codon:yes stop_codon:yes gene_type:complete